MSTGCRIGKVRMKNGGAEITVLPTPRHDETNFVPTLVAMLAYARARKLLGYSIVFRCEEDDGSVSGVEGSMADTSGNPDALLGLMRRAEYNYLTHNWPADETDDAS